MSIDSDRLPTFFKSFNLKKEYCHLSFTIINERTCQRMLKTARRQTTHYAVHRHKCMITTNFLCNPILWQWSNSLFCLLLPTVKFSDRFSVRILLISWSTVLMIVTLESWFIVNRWYFHYFSGPIRAEVITVCSICGCPTTFVSINKVSWRTKLEKEKKLDQK